MKVIYCEFGFNGTYRYVKAYLTMDEAATAIREGRDVETGIVPDGWGEPGFIDWANDERIVTTKLTAGV